MAKAVSYETVHGVNRVEFGGPNGLIRVDADKPFTTSDPAEIAACDAQDSVERAKAKGGKS